MVQLNLFLIYTQLMVHSNNNRAQREEQTLNINLYCCWAVLQLVYKNETRALELHSKLIKILKTVKISIKIVQSSVCEK